MTECTNSAVRSGTRPNAPSQVLSSDICRAFEMTPHNDSVNDRFGTGIFAESRNKGDNQVTSVRLKRLDTTATQRSKRAHQPAPHTDGIVLRRILRLALWHGSVSASTVHC
jgi:hypothetical protein